MMIVVAVRVTFRVGCIGLCRVIVEVIWYWCSDNGRQRSPQKSLRTGGEWLSKAFSANSSASGAQGRKKWTTDCRTRRILVKMAIVRIFKETYDERRGLTALVEIAILVVRLLFERRRRCTSCIQTSHSAVDVVLEVLAAT